MKNINNICGQNNIVTEAIDKYDYWCKDKMFKIHVGENNEIVVVGGQAYHNSIPTRIFDFCVMKLIMTAIGTTEVELASLNGQFYQTREMSCLRE